MYTCKQCGKESNRCVFIAAKRYFPRAVSGPITIESDDFDIEHFCSVMPCLLAFYKE
jgi:hypothetical protein